MVLNEFECLIEDYKNNFSLVDKIKNYVLNHIYTLENILEYIDLFSKTANKINDPVGCALSRGMYFWVYHGSNIELAHKYNKEALDMYHNIENYRYKPGYLSILNNELIYNNYKANLYQSYMIMSEGMDIAEETKNINYFYSFAVNGFYLLLDLGLTDKADAVLKKLESNNASLSLAEKGIMLILKIKIYYRTDKELCLKYAYELVKTNEEKDIFAPYLVYSYMLNVLALNDKLDEAKEFEAKLQAELANGNLTDAVDLSEAYLALARYNMKLANKQEAFKYYKLLFPRYNNILGSKLIVISECCDIYKEFDKELYVEALEAKDKLLEDIHNTFVLAINSDKKMYDSFLDLRYKYLFDKMTCLVSFISEIDKLTDKENIDTIIESNIKNILNAKECKVIVGPDDLVYKDVNLSGIESLKIFEHDELPECLKHKYDILAVIKIPKDKMCNNLYILIGFFAMGNLEKKENYYMIELTKETISPILVQIDKYNTAVSNYLRDELTKLYNRYGLNRNINNKQFQGIDSYLLMVDIDDFKKINDTYGHAEGDVVLIKLADTLKLCLGDENVARIGGEEFVGFIEKDETTIDSKLDNILKEVSKIKVDNKALTVSIGVSLLNHDSIFNDSKDYADKALYKAKNNGKNQYVFYNDIK